MSIREEIARLTGRLVFEVNSAPLQRFQALMNRSTQTMAKFGEEYNKLAAAMNKTLKLKVDSSACIGVLRREGAGRIKRLALKQLWLQDKVKAGEVLLEKLPRCLPLVASRH